MASLLSSASDLLRELRSALGTEGVLSDPADLLVYECDGFTIQKNVPQAVVFPRTTGEIAEVLTVCNRYRVPVVPRAAGTSLAGGCLPVDGGVVLMTTRMRRILEVNLRDRMAVVEPGVPNVQLGRALAGSGFHFAPDPSSQGASTIGGNVATNAGGPHTLKYGVTGNHVLGVEAVLPDGEIIQLGPVANPGEMDLLGVLVGSEGTLAVITKIWVKLTPNPQAYRTLRVMFDTVDAAGEAISDIIGEGIIPAAMELMDQGIIRAVEQAFHFGFPLDVGAMAVIELDGVEADLDDQVARIVGLCRMHGAKEILFATDAEERALLWKCRKLAVGAVGRLAPSYCIQDGVVPRTKLPRIIRKVVELSKKYDVGIVNVAHAGDGNVHPILLFDERDIEQVGRVLEAGRELLEECIACGGSITAEHGVGVEKIELMPRLFKPRDLEAMAAVRDVFNPDGLLGRGKVLPNRGGTVRRGLHSGA